MRLLHAILRRVLAAAALAALIGAAPASAQLGLPDLPVDLPTDLPATDALGDLADGALGTADDVLDTRLLREARSLELARLLRANRDVLEALPSDELIVRSEVLALDPSDAALAAALGQGFTVVRQRALAALGARIVVLAAPPGLSTTAALDALRTLDPAGAYDFNHVYTGSGLIAGSPRTTPAGDAGAGSAVGPAIGLIDGGVDAGHRAFARATIASRAFHPAGYQASAHGTAVASLLIGGDGPVARLLAADVYGGAPTGGAADGVAAAFSWLAEERAGVINVSLVGAQNALLDVVIARLAARGHLIVAAAGNDGPAAPPLYPAAHPDVIAVTGVDRRRRALIEAGRGDHVMFAARGDEVRVAELGGRMTRARGTSFAAPVVARQLAAVLWEPDPARARTAVQMLVDRVRDLGPRGRDATYGYGLVDDDSARLLQAAAPAAN